MTAGTHTTFAIIANNKPNRFGKYTLFIRITKNKKKSYVKSSVEVSDLKHFNKRPRNDNWIRQSDPESAIKNETLAKELAGVKKIHSDMAYNKEYLTASEIKRGVEDQTNPDKSFFEFTKGFTENLRNGGQYNYYKIFLSLQNRLEDFMKKQKMNDIEFEDLTPKFIDDFYSYLKGASNKLVKDKKRKLHDNTIMNHMKRLRTLTYKAINLGYLDSSKDPFRNFKFSWKETTKEKLEFEEIVKIIQLHLEPGTVVWHVRNCFLFSLFYAGIRIGDLLQLRWRNIVGDRLIYVMSKNGKVQDLPIIAITAKILDLYKKKESKIDDYIFPFLDNRSSYSKAVTQKEKETMSPDIKEKLYQQISSKNALINKELKTIEKLAEIDKHISFHVSRHSFAKLGRDQNTPSMMMKELLAHSSLKTTEGYMGQFDTVAQDDALRNIFKPFDQILGDENKEERMEREKIEVKNLLSTMTDEQKELLLSLLNEGKQN